MITILPMSDQKEELIILEKLTKKENNARVLLMKDNEIIVGWVVVDIIKNCLRMLNFHIENEATISSIEKDFYFDTLMRSAASFGETNGADFLETIDNTYNDFLKKKGFTTDNSHAFTDMSTIIHYS